MRILSHLTGETAAGRYVTRGLARRIMRALINGINRIIDIMTLFLNRTLRLRRESYFAVNRSYRLSFRSGGSEERTGAERIIAYAGMHRHARRVSSTARLIGGGGVFIV